jgi:IBR domain, a half RING-finger domain
LEGENDTGDYEYELDPHRLETRWRSTSSVERSEENVMSYASDGSCMQCGDSVPAFMLEERILEVDGLTVGICMACYPDFVQFLEDASVDDGVISAAARADWLVNANANVPRRSSTRRSSAPERFQTLGMRLTIANPSEDDLEIAEQPTPPAPTPQQRRHSEAAQAHIRSIRSVNNPTSAQECSICNDTYPVFDFVAATTTCNHPITYCRTCLSTWITSSLSTVGWIAICCPSDSCKAPLSATDVHLHADKATLESYTAAATKSTLSALPNFQWCLSPTCASGQIHESGEDGPILTCHACGFRSCVVHAVPWHEGQTCNEYEYGRNMSLKRREEMASLAIVAQTTKRCPKRNGGCGAPITKIDGCDHMVCKRGGCGFQFCWICGAAHEPIMEHGNSRHEVWCKHYRRG